MSILFVLSILAAVGLGIYYSRYIIREKYFEIRKNRVGGIAWYQIVSEGSLSGDRGEYTINDMGYLKTLLQSLLSTLKGMGYLDRGLANAVWVKNPETGMIDLFFGISRNHDGNGKIANQVAAGMGAKAIRLDHPPIFPNKTPNVLWRQGSKFGNVRSENVVKGSGHVPTALSEAWSDLSQGESAAVFLGIEQVRKKESEELRSFIMNRTVQDAGQFASAPSLSDKSAVVSEGFRAVVASANTRGSEQLSKVTLNATDGALGSSGWRVVATKPNEKQALTGSIIGGVIGLALGLLALLISGGNLLLSSIVFIIPTLAGISGFVVSDEIAQRVFARGLKKGELAVPPYIHYGNVWKYIKKNKNHHKSLNAEDIGAAPRFAVPAPKQVIYLHFSPMFEFLSFPERSGSSGDIEGDMIQNIGLPSSFVELNEDVIYLGQSGKGQTVTYDIDNLSYGLFAGGAPSSGKTNFLHVIYAGLVHYMSEKNDVPNKKLITPIWFETKGQGAYDTFEAARMAGSDPILIDFNNPKNFYKMRLEGRSIAQGASVTEVEESVTNFVTGTQSAWGDSIRGASRDALYAYILIAMMLTPKHIEFLGLDDVIDVDNINIIDLAYLLTGANSAYMQPKDDQLLSLRDAILEREGDFKDPASYGSTRENDEALARVIGEYSNRFFTPEGVRSSQTVITAVQNKINDLRKLPNMWVNPERKDWKEITLDDIVGSGRPIIANMGGYVDGITPEGGYTYKNVDTSLSARVIKILNYLIWNYIRQNCNGWQALGRYTPIFADEAADIAQGADSEDVPDVLQQGTKEGRSFGTAYFLGAQSIMQLPKKTQTMVLGFRSKFWYNLHNIEDLEVAAKDLNSSSNVSDHIVEISPGNIRNLRNGSAMGIMAKGGSVTPPFTLYAPYHKDWTKAIFEDSHGGVVDGVMAYLKNHQEEEIKERAEKSVIDYGTHRSI